MLFGPIAGASPGKQVECLAKAYSALLESVGLDAIVRMHPVGDVLQLDVVIQAEPGLDPPLLNVARDSIGEKIAEVSESRLSGVGGRFGPTGRLVARVTILGKPRLKNIQYLRQVIDRPMSLRFNISGKVLTASSSSAALPGWLFL